MRHVSKKICVYVDPVVEASTVLNTCLVPGVVSAPGGTDRRGVRQSACSVMPTVIVPEQSALRTWRACPRHGHAQRSANFLC